MLSYSLHVLRLNQTSKMPNIRSVSLVVEHIVTVLTCCGQCECYASSVCCWLKGEMLLCHEPCVCLCRVLSLKGMIFPSNSFTFKKLHLSLINIFCLLTSYSHERSSLFQAQFDTTCRKWFSWTKNFEKSLSALLANVMCTFMCSFQDILYCSIELSWKWNTVHWQTSVSTW